MKNWIHIILSVWLINAVTYFHSSNPADHFAYIQNDSPEKDDCLHINTWTDYVLESVIAIDQDDETHPNAHKIKYQRRYVRSSTSNYQLFISASGCYLYFQQVKNKVIKEVSHYTIGVALLPSYYNFLFRLCPF